MNQQQIFDTVVTALIEQGEPSYEPDVGCLYRGPRGLKCAAGHLIPDGRYKPIMEGKSSTSEYVAPALRGFASAANLRLIGRLQAAHDDTAMNYRDGGPWIRRFLERARAIANSNGLSDAACDSGSRAERQDREDGLGPQGRQSGPKGIAQ